ncbi:mRNA splicing protein [Tilletia horrida]|uniref:Pre-mRNA-processing protein 45 n=1 Tax=Tilletia horrida TaxID=155126 RepID=A0AAN6G3F4_9BASI|nr:mRNA splicing protein [Tilletia horrida]
MSSSSWTTTTTTTTRGILSHNMATLSSLLPAPRHSGGGGGSLADQLPAPRSAAVDTHSLLVGGSGSGSGSTSGSGSGSASASSSTARSRIPPYGKRDGWKPREQADFGNGGAYPECHIAQYPLEMGRKKTGGSGASLALQVDAEGNVRYDALVQQGRKDGQHVQSSHRDLIPLKQRPDYKETSGELDRPSADVVRETAERTRLALEKITQGKIKAAQPKNIQVTGGSSSFVRYTPGGQGEGQQRIIKMTEVVEDPLEPPKWKFKKVPKGPPSPPPPVLRSPPRKITAQEQREWMIPPCISNWKNNKGFTVPLDKRLAADGRGLQDVHINDNFAQFSESLHIADRHAREEVRQRAMMQQKLAAKEKAAKEENLRLLAQRAREERSGVASGSLDAIAGPSSSKGPILAPNTAGRPTAASVTAAAASGSGSAMKAALAGYGSDSGSGSDDDDDNDSEDEAAAKARDELRAERRREHERELRMSNMGTEQRARVLMREQNRDISEKIALGLAKPTLSKDSQLDSRLFNQESYSGSFGDEESNNLYDKSLFQGSTAAAAIYRRPAGHGGADDIYGGGTEEGFGEEMQNDRFGLGKSKAFSGSELQEPRHGPVQFEKDTSDPFAIDKFLDEAKRGTKRAAGDDADVDTRKRQRD